MGSGHNLPSCSRVWELRTFSTLAHHYQLVPPLGSYHRVVGGGEGEVVAVAAVAAREEEEVEGRVAVAVVVEEV